MNLEFKVYRVYNVSIKKDELNDVFFPLTIEIKKLFRTFCNQDPVLFPPTIDL